MEIVEDVVDALELPFFCAKCKYEDQLMSKMYLGPDVLEGSVFCGMQPLIEIVPNTQERDIAYD